MAAGGTSFVFSKRRSPQTRPVLVRLIWPWEIQLLCAQSMVLRKDAEEMRPVVQQVLREQWWKSMSTSLDSRELIAREGREEATSMHTNAIDTNAIYCS